MSMIAHLTEWLKGLNEITEEKTFGDLQASTEM